MDKFELFYLVGIFYDIVKGCGGDYFEFGLVDVIVFVKLYCFLLLDGKFILWLVVNYLFMLVIVQCKDINDLDVIKDFVSKVKNECQLDYLYCLILVDICVINDNLWNDWKNILLCELYLYIQ